jgi:hypothetical protein
MWSARSSISQALRRMLQRRFKIHIASRLCSMCVVAERAHCAWRYVPCKRSHCGAGDAGLLCGAQAGRGAALQMRSAFCLDGLKRMFYFFVADNDVNRAVIAHFDETPPPAIGKKLTSYIQEAIRKVHIISAPKIKYFNPEDPPHMPFSTAPPGDDASANLSFVEDLTPSAQVGVRNMVADRVRCPPSPPPHRAAVFPLVSPHASDAPPSRRWRRPVRQCASRIEKM